jgi:alkylation response protein AidB-like acyl-CoA dehydrogenase
MLPPLAALPQELRKLAAVDPLGGWPEAQWRQLIHAGAARWNIPRDFDGDGWTGLQLLNAYRDIARGSLVAAFLLTQRNAACQRIESSPNVTARQQLLPALARAEFFATVGISHLTTSRQHLPLPAVVAAPLSSGCYRLDGCIPWASGASHAQVLVTGGTLADGRQLLAAVNTRTAGVKIHPPTPLLGLSESCTGAVELHGVEVTPPDLLHGPVEKVMAVSGGGAGSFSTTAVALGAALGTLDQLSAEARLNSGLRRYLEPLEAEASRIDSDLATAAAAATPPPTPSAHPDQLRHRANSLAIRAAQVWMAASKGAGYSLGHPAERAVRESLFFLVWSCPQTVLESHLQDLCFHHSAGTPAAGN